MEKFIEEVIAQETMYTQPIRVNSGCNIGNEIFVYEVCGVAKKKAQTKKRKILKEIQNKKIQSSKEIDKEKVKLVKRIKNG